MLEFEDHIDCEPGCEERLGDPRELAAGFDSGLSLALFVPAFFGMFLAPQVALVAGTLAALRALRRRRVRSLPASEIGLIGRRTRVVLLAGFATVAGLELYAVDFSLVLLVSRACCRFKRAGGGGAGRGADRPQPLQDDRVVPPGSGRRRV